MASSRRHVCIVGAGISGLRCAEVLLENGFKVTILEARHRIGGRICQSDKLGYEVDLGPNWIHTSGQSRNPILELAKKTQTPLHHWNDKQAIYSPSGVLLPAKHTDRLSELLWKFIAEAFAYSKAHGDAIPADASLRDFVKGRAKEALGEGEDMELLMQMAEMWGAYIGDEVGKQSLKWAWMEECCGGDSETFVETTFAAILAAIARLPLENAEVRLNCKVVRVNTTPREGDEKVTIMTAEGDELEFDEVVMTTPLGWLKRNLDSFIPPLPPRLISGIGNLSVGKLEKVYITFPTAFWLSSTTTAEDTFPGYTNWLSPTYVPLTNPLRFPIEMWNLASFTPPNAHPTLIFYLYGSLSSHLITLLSASPTSINHSLLEQFFHPYIALLSSYNPDSEECTPQAILNTNWQEDELAGNGSYMNVQVGSEGAQGDVEVLRKGVEERRLWFCGEHTSPFEELGTVGGAYLSGEGVANRIVDMYGTDEELVNGCEKE